MQDMVTQAGDPVLRAVAAAVPKKDIGSKRVQAIVTKMKKVLAKEDYGVAIAAPQVGESLRIFVVAGKVFSENRPAQKKVLGSSLRTQPDHFSEQDGTPPPDRVFINPELTRLSRKKTEMSEGCLSVRGKYGTVMRHEKATIKALDEQGKPVTYHGSGLLGHIFQHECDHLDGILYIDKAVRLEEDEDMKGARQKIKEKSGI